MTTGFSVLYQGLCIMEVFAWKNLNCGVIHMCRLLMIHLYLKWLMFLEKQTIQQYSWPLNFVCDLYLKLFSFSDITSLTFAFASLHSQSSIPTDTAF